MTDLETLRPEVREDVIQVSRWMFGDEHWPRVRAELLRLAKENADLLSTIDLDEQVWVQRDETMHRWIERARNAEAELAAIKARIADAPNMIVVSLPFTIELRADHSSEDAARVSMLDGKRVRLVVEE